ncbi:conserved hypothetical [Parasynechococcus marenigrum WH 8102]|uniref:Conserved hypothetical n=1 Tax=Parasynechococcus marenigrum (strain WH8102) TaxID=84588 RepID=Q7U6F5_PARMW|nr:conserved hypothetical [Parasynechococcus marenigrum WH 8102]
MFRWNSTTPALDDGWLQRTGQGMKRLMLAFQDHGADRIGVGEFELHGLGISQDQRPATGSRCLAAE